MFKYPYEPMAPPLTGTLKSGNKDENWNPETLFLSNEHLWTVKIHLGHAPEPAVKAPPSGPVVDF